MKLCVLVGLRDVITTANFFDYQLRGSGVARGVVKFWVSPCIDLRRRHYNTLTMPRECLINALLYRLSYQQYDCSRLYQLACTAQCSLTKACSWFIDGSSMLYAYNLHLLHTTLCLAFWHAAYRITMTWNIARSFCDSQASGWRFIRITGCLWICRIRNIKSFNTT